MLKHQLKIKKAPVPVGYTLDKNNVPYNKEQKNYIVTNVKGNNVRDSYSTNSRITEVLPNNATITYDGHIASMDIDGLLI
ncbi:amidase (fragment) [Staphylococcus schweitzeri]